MVYKSRTLFTWIFVPGNFWNPLTSHKNVRPSIFVFFFLFYKQCLMYIEGTQRKQRPFFECFGCWVEMCCSNRREINSADKGYTVCLWFLNSVYGWMWRKLTAIGLKSPFEAHERASRLEWFKNCLRMLFQFSELEWITNVLKIHALA